LRPTAVRADILAIGLAASIAAVLAALAVLQCGAATAAGADRISSSPQVDPGGTRVLAGLSDPSAGQLGLISLAVAFVGYAGLGAVVVRRGGSRRFAALLAGLSFAAASLVALVIEQVLYPTAYYYFATGNSVAYYIVNLAYVFVIILAGVVAAIAVGAGALVRLMTR